MDHEQTTTATINIDSDNRKDDNSELSKLSWVESPIAIGNNDIENLKNNTPNQ